MQIASFHTGTMAANILSIKSAFECIANAFVFVV